MTLTVEVFLALIVVVVLAGVALRIRKLRRDTFREITRSTDRRLMTPPPSPYATSKGFRLLDESGVPIARPDPVRPRLEPDREYVFSDSQMAPYEEPLGASLRKNEVWALSRSAHRPKVHVTTMRVGVGFALIVIVLAVGGYLLRQVGTNKPVTTTSSTTSTTLHSTTAATWPKSFVAQSTSGQSATYIVPATKYRVTVSGSLGPSWAKFEMGPQSTLEWQGTVQSGTSESLQLTGNSSITLGSPKNATVTVGGSPVVFPTPLPATMTLNFEVSSG
jgi:hypothetical protein